MVEVWPTEVPFLKSSTEEETGPPLPVTVTFAPTPMGSSTMVWAASGIWDKSKMAKPVDFKRGWIMDFMESGIHYDCDDAG